MLTFVYFRGQWLQLYSVLCLLNWLAKNFLLNWTKSIGTFLREWFSFRLQVQVHFFSSTDVLSRYWLFVSLYYPVCFASSAVCAAAQWNGSGKWSARIIQPLLTPAFSTLFHSWFVSSAWSLSDAMGSYKHHRDGNKQIRKVCGRRATPTSLAWLLNVEWQLKLLFRIFLEFCSEKQYLRVFFASLFPF